MLRDRPSEASTGSSAAGSAAERRAVVLALVVQLGAVAKQHGAVVAVERIGRRPVGAAAVDHVLAPAQVVEGLHRHAVAQAQVSHQGRLRTQDFLDLRARAARGAGIEGAHGVNARHEQRFAPVDHLVAQLGAQRLAAQVPVGEHIGVGQRHAVEGGQLVEAGVAQFSVLLVAVVEMPVRHLLAFQDAVVPREAAHEHAVGIAFQFQFACQLADGGIGIVLLEVQVAVVGAGARRAAIGYRDQVLVCILHPDAGADRHVQGPASFQSIVGGEGICVRQWGCQRRRHGERHDTVVLPRHPSVS